MRVFSIKHNGSWPYNDTSVVVAKNEEEAKKLLREAFVIKYQVEIKITEISEIKTTQSAAYINSK